MPDTLPLPSPSESFLQTSGNAAFAIATAPVGDSGYKLGATVNQVFDTSYTYTISMSTLTAAERTSLGITGTRVSNFDRDVSGTLDWEQFGADLAAVEAFIRDEMQRSVDQLNAAIAAEEAAATP